MLGMARRHRRQYLVDTPSFLPHLWEHDSPPFRCTQAEIFCFVDALQVASQTGVTRVRRKGPVDSFCGVHIGRVIFPESKL
jgi:hypothetical protein